MHGFNTALTQRLGIRYPILQAPMAGGPGTPQLIAAVSNVGGLGSLAGGGLSPDDLRQAIGAVRALTDRPFSVNLPVPAIVQADPERWARACALLTPFCAELGLSPEWSTPPTPPDLGEQITVLIQEKIPVVSLSFGVPNSTVLKRIQDAGLVICGTATHLLEAIVLEESGVDFIIAQGAEAGGHRGTFVGHMELGLVGTLTLVPLLAQHVKVPVIASGGIMDGRGIAAAQILGAAGVQMGTAFLACPESDLHPAHKRLLREGSEIATTLSRAFTGRYARVLRNRFTEALRAHESELPGFPWQLFLTHALREAALIQGKPDFMALWAGQGAHLCEEKPAAQLINTWVAQAMQLLGGNQSI